MGRAEIGIEQRRKEEERKDRGSACMGINIGR